MLDLDHFKNINDMYGHLFGGGVLVAVFDVLRKNIRKSDIHGRYWGGEEFLKVSAGVTSVSNNFNPTDLIKKADKLLYKAKANGRNRVEYPLFIKVSLFFLLSVLVRVRPQCQILQILL